MQTSNAEKKRAVVFVTDRGFLVPSIVAALQVARQPRAVSIADVFVVLIDMGSDIIASLTGHFEKSGLNFLPMPSGLFLPPENTFFNRTHVPRSALGRLALHRVLPDRYEHIVYLDGDTQIVGDITPLLCHSVQPGHVAAVPEGNWLCAGDFGDYWPKHRAYMTSLGIEDPRDYFNSGVLAFRMDTWREMAPKALEYFVRYPEKCLYHDQSALNAIFCGRNERLSPIYNFLSLYAELDVADKIKPRIIHFTGGNKPWNYLGPPWNGRFIDIYRTFVERYPMVSSHLRVESRQAIGAHSPSGVVGYIKDGLVLPWRRRRRRRLLIDYVTKNDFVLRE